MTDNQTIVNIVDNFWVEYCNKMFHTDTIDDPELEKEFFRVMLGEPNGCIDTLIDLTAILLDVEDTTEISKTIQEMLLLAESLREKVKHQSS